MSKFYNGFFAFFRLPMRILYRIKVEGRENIPEDGFILASNHTAMMDVIVLSYAMNGRQIRYMAKKELFSIPGLKQLITALGAYPVDRGGADVKSIKRAIGMIQNREILGIFPQGTRHQGEDPRETKVKGGIGLIAYHAKAQILPVYIDNERKQTSMFRRNRIIIGKPIPYDDLGFEKGGSAEYTAASEKIFGRICELKYGPECESKTDGDDSVEKTI